MSRIVSSVLVVLTGSLCVYAQDNTAASASAATSARWQSFAAELTYLDANQDGHIDARELATGQQMASMMLMLSWEACDRNQDGQLTPAEFQAAATDALQALLSADSAVDEEAEQALAEAMPVGVLLRQLGRDQAYAGELAALREAVEDVDDDETVVTHVISNPTLYPRLSPVIRTWVRHYPAKSKIRHHVRPHLRRVPKPAKLPRVHGAHKPVQKHGKPGVVKPQRPAKPAKPKAKKASPRGGGSRRP